MRERSTADFHHKIRVLFLKLPYRKLKRNRSAYEASLVGIFGGAVGWIRNAYSHEKHNLPELESKEALELLFVARYLLQMLDYSLAPR
jgi:hypothetical protein